MNQIDCPALHERSSIYPPRFDGKVPRRIKMLRAVQADEPMRSLSPEWRNVIAEHSMIYFAWTNRHGAVAAILDNGQKLGLKPDEFEVVDYYT